MDALKYPTLTRILASTPTAPFLQAIRKVADQARFDLPGDAYWQCSDFSTAVKVLADELQIPCELMRVTSVPYGQDQEGHAAGEFGNHIYFEIGGTYYDFTARQFDSENEESPYPLESAAPLWDHTRSITDIQMQNLLADEDGWRFYYDKLKAAL